DESSRGDVLADVAEVPRLPDQRPVVRPLVERLRDPGRAAGDAAIGDELHAEYVERTRRRAAIGILVPRGVMDEEGHLGDERSRLDGLAPDVGLVRSARVPKPR